MATRTKLLRGRNINTDSDFSKYIETVSEPGVIEGMVVSSGKVGVGKCWVPCERTNGETIYSLVENFTEISINTSGTGFVIVSIPQNMIDDGSIINEDGTNVASIQVVNELPEKNYLLLASISSGTITDRRNMIRKVGELNSLIESIFSQVDNLDERVEALEESGTVQRLEELGYRGEGYQNLDKKWFRQYTPTNANSTYDNTCRVGYDGSSTEVHIQRIFNGVESNKLKLKIRMVGSPTTNVKVEVRKGVDTGIGSIGERYWYGNEIIAYGSLSYNNFSTSRQEKEFTLDKVISGNDGDLLDVVVYQETGGSKVVNSSNYYVIACDVKQWSEAFRFINVNGSTRSPQVYMPYCVSNSFANWVFSKVDSAKGVSTTETLTETSGAAYGNSITDSIFTATTAGVYVFTCNLTWSSQNSSAAYFTLSKNNETLKNVTVFNSSSTPFELEFSLAANDVLKVTYGGPSYTTGGFNSAVLKRYTNFFSKGNTAHKLKQLEVKTIGKKHKYCSFGRLDNGDWWDGE